MDIFKKYFLKLGNLGFTLVVFILCSVPVLLILFGTFWFLDNQIGETIYLIYLLIKGIILFLVAYVLFVIFTYISTKRLKSYSSVIEYKKTKFMKILSTQLVILFGTVIIFGILLIPLTMITVSYLGYIYILTIFPLFTYGVLVVHGLHVPSYLELYDNNVTQKYDNYIEVLVQYRSSLGLVYIIYITFIISLLVTNINSVTFIVTLIFSIILLFSYLVILAFLPLVIFIIYEVALGEMEKEITEKFTEEQKHLYEMQKLKGGNATKTSQLEEVIEFYTMQLDVSNLNTEEYSDLSDMQQNTDSIEKTVIPPMEEKATPIEVEEEKATPIEVEEEKATPIEVEEDKIAPIEEEELEIEGESLEEEIERKFFGNPEI